jgi:glutaredoxin
MKKEEKSTGGFKLNRKRNIDIFSAGCAACEEVVSLITQIACRSCEVNVLDMHNIEIAERAQRLGIHTVPSIVIDGRIADCCRGNAPDEKTLRVAGVGQLIE